MPAACEGARLLFLPSPQEMALAESATPYRAFAGDLPDCSMTLVGIGIALAMTAA